MNSPQFYSWLRTLSAAFPMLGAHQLRGLVLLSYGLVLSKQATLSQIALALTSPRQVNTMVRRLQRWLSNPRLPWAAIQDRWVCWLLQRLPDRGLLLVDETKLSTHLGVMMVGVAVQGGCIPLIWRCYNPNAYPPEGQVNLILGLLQRVVPFLTTPRDWAVLADRGIGTSSALFSALPQLGLNALLRVQHTTRIRLTSGCVLSLGALVNRPGQVWSGSGWVFKKAGWRRVVVHVYWASRQPEPWCLLSYDQRVIPAMYALRFQHEVSFRDLKSDGWQWQRSRVWLPDHAERLVLALALSYAWVLLHGHLVVQHEPGPSRYGCFRRGLDFLRDRLRRHLPCLFTLSFWLPPPFP